MKKRTWMAMLAMVFICTPALAGPNAGGTLIVHNTGQIYTTDVTDYCGTAPLGACGDAVVRMDGPSLVVWSLYAAFAPEAGPRLKGLTFGIDYDPSDVFLVALGKCGDFEVTTDSWPQPGAGTGMTFDTPQTSALVEIYWFAGYNYYGAPQTFAVIPHPTQGGSFADDSVPALIDEVADYGALGFDTDGYLPCPVLEAGACCFTDGSCLYTTPDDCAVSGGEFVGGLCDPNPCPQPPVGACCFDDVCVLMTEAGCEGQDGVWDGSESCDPNPCGYIQTYEATWGQIKAGY